jgi:diguanylate cyclase (GGDEF)-like protein
MNPEGQTAGTVRIIGSRGSVGRGFVRLIEVSPFILAGVAVIAIVPSPPEVRFGGGTALLALTVFRSVAEVRGFPQWIQTIIPISLAFVIGAMVGIAEEPLFNVLMLFNLLRVALVNSRRILLYTLAATVVALVVPGLIHPDDLATRAAIWALVLTSITFPIQNRSLALRARVGLNSKLASVLSDLLTSDDARASIVRAAHELGEADVAILFEEGTDGTIAASASYGVMSTGLIVEHADSSAAGLSISERRTIFAPYVESLDGSLPPGLANEELSTIICCPILRGDKAIGTLCAGWKKPVRRSDQLNATVVSLLAAEAATTIDHSDTFQSLAETATRDSLTGLPNRRSWEELLRAGLTDSHTVKKPVSIAILDLDHFKQYNDTHGHQSGDRLLCEAVASWKNTLRNNDLLFRWGGEEFTVMLPNCDPDQALEVVERLRAATPGDQTSSAGVATWDGRETAEDLFERTDSALYLAKGSGRNQTVPASNPKS